MKVIRRGIEKAPTMRYEFECKHCHSILRAKDYELRPFHGMRKQVIYYIYMCPVCNVQRTIPASELTKLPGLKRRIWEFLREKVDEDEAEEMADEQVDEIVTEDSAGRLSYKVGDIPWVLERI